MKTFFNLIMKYIYSKIKTDKLLHIINRLQDIKERTNVAPPEQFLQLATLNFDKGVTFKPHKHIWKSPNYDKTIAQESWIIIKGSVKIFMYDIDDKLLDEEILYPGDCSMTFEGGHTYRMLEDETIVYEYKTGPYHGQSNDKVFIKDHRL